ncbi:hypothetical protein MLD38_024613 [Melastoma candidum]|uniref:Uncharacterized protein n=1 Tax=Melastoma candidum TaxID=119954 RepID=A0ACB9NUJ0_9MYRT|nr:hypothetical protein MLD38_024613 [Melastoma candidum]
MLVLLQLQGLLSFGLKAVRPSLLSGRDRRRDGSDNLWLLCIISPVGFSSSSSPNLLPAMLGNVLASPPMIIAQLPASPGRLPSHSDASTRVATARFPRASFFRSFLLDVKRPWSPNFSPRKSAARSATSAVALSEEEINAWEACRPTLSAFGFSVEEQDKILGKAFGQISSPYWSEERERETPNSELIKETLEYLRSLNLSDDDLSKILKKFPEVLGCSLEQELKNNVKVLDMEWGIQGKTLRNLLLRNPKVLGYNIDCKGDCMAQCTRCWIPDFRSPPWFVPIGLLFVQG